MKCLIVNTAQCSQVVKLNTIVYFLAEGSYTRIFLKNNKSIVCSKNLSWFENKIDSSLFTRIHRSYLVNLEYVIQFKTEGEIGLVNGLKLPISRYRYKNFVDALHGLNIR